MQGVGDDVKPHEHDEDDHRGSKERYMQKNDWVVISLKKVGRIVFSCDVLCRRNCEVVSVV